MSDYARAVTGIIATTIAFDIFFCGCILLDESFLQMLRTALLVG